VKGLWVEPVLSACEVDVVTAAESYYHYTDLLEKFDYVVALSV
jgi:hypothetical protein